MKKKSGSVLLFSLLILSALVLLSQQLIQNIFVGSRFDTTMINREKAEILALSGINVAMALLQEPYINIQQKDIEAKDQNTPLKKQLQTLLPLLNQWKTFPLTYEHDGIDGSLSLCITSEEGKIPLSHIYDLKNHTIKAPFDTLLKKIPFAKKTQKKNHAKSDMQKLESLEKKDLSITDALISFFKKRNCPLDDISELYNIEKCAELPLWYNPSFPLNEVTQKKKEQSTTELALHDIVTLYGKSTTMHPLLLSDGVKALLEVGRVEPLPFEKRKELLKPFIEKYQDTWSQDWIGNWKQLQVIHSQNPKNLSFFKDIFTSKFEPMTFSVLSSGIVQGIEQRICAIITKDTSYTTSTNEESERLKKADTQEPLVKKAQKRPFKVLKLYWI